MNDTQRILNILSGLRVPPQPEEYEIHDMIAAAFQDAGVEFVHECKLLPGRRIDFCCGRIGIEVKKRPARVGGSAEAADPLSGERQT